MKKIKKIIHADIYPFVETLYRNEIYDTKELFILYDNKHIRGIDIKQPFILKGMCSINDNNLLSDIAQASFRLRNLNYGHTIDYLISSSVIKFLPKKTRFDLLLYLMNKENDYVNGNMEMFKLIQYIKYLKRANNMLKEEFNWYDNYFNKYFLEYDLYKNTSINPYLLYDFDYYEYFLSDLQNDNVIIKELYTQLIELYHNIKKSEKHQYELNNVQEKEREKERKKNGKKNRKKKKKKKNRER